MDANWILSMNFPNLTHLDISGCNVQNNEFHMLSNLPFLVMLNLSYNNNLSTLQGLEKLRDLKAINIENCAISDLTPLQKLQHLELIALTQFIYNFELSEFSKMNTHLKILKGTCDWKKELLERKIIAVDAIVW
jgi:Leucine-rich repeat (LRR) protein